MFRMKCYDGTEILMNMANNIYSGVLGNYDPVIVEYEYSDRNGYKNYLRDVQPDYVWLCSCALLALVIYCLFRLGGALLRD